MYNFLKQLMKIVGESEQKKQLPEFPLKYLVLSKAKMNKRDWKRVKVGTAGLRLSQSKSCN